MEDCTYSTKLLFTKISPPRVHGMIPRIGKEKLLGRLAKYGIDERRMEDYRCDDGSYAIPLPYGYLLIIRPIGRRWHNLRGYLGDQL